MWVVDKSLVEEYKAGGCGLDVTPSLCGTDFFPHQRDPEGEVSNLGWLIGLFINAMYADSLYFL
jgi:hypothetical protein